MALDVSKIASKDVGAVKLDSSLFPDAIQFMRIEQEVKMERVEVEGRSGRAKLAEGFQDADISIEFKLTDDSPEGGATAVEKLQYIQDFFRKTDNRGKPNIYRLSNAHTKARKIGQVIFLRLSSRETNSKDTLIATLHFTEYEPIAVTIEDQANQMSLAESTRPSEADELDQLMSYEEPDMSIGPPWPTDDAVAPEMPS